MTQVIEPKIAATRQRAEQLQFLRFLAFINVFLVHTEEWAFFAYPRSHCSNAAVSFFFMLSGLVIGLSGFDREMHLSGGEIGKNFEMLVSHGSTGSGYCFFHSSPV